jgi:hypothetical protein
LIAPSWLISDAETGKPYGAANLLRQAFYSVQPARKLEQLDFVRLGIDDPMWDDSTFLPRTATS